MSEPQGDLNANLQYLAGLLGRRKWWVLVPTLVIATGAGVLLRHLPNRYQSEATLEIVQPAVSQRYVATDAGPADIIQAIKREVLSRTRLLAVIDEFNLYAKQRPKMPPEALAEVMRKAVEVEPLSDVPNRLEPTAFMVSFTAESAQLAQAVTARLTALFIETRLRREENGVAATSRFLEDQLDAAKRQLAIQEQRRRDFQMRHIDDLPLQQQGSFAVLIDLRAQLQATLNRMAQVEQQKGSLESSLSDKLARLQSEKSALLARFTSRHPEVIQKDEAIARMTALLEGIKTGSIEKQETPGMPVSDDPAVDTWIKQMRANRVERENLAKEEARTRSEIAAYQSRLNLIPVHDQELQIILRDYDLYSQNVKALESELLQAQQANSLVERQEAQQFRLVDAPTLPVAPSSPSRLKVSLAGLALGLVAGLACAFLREMMAAVFHEEAAISQHFKVPLILAIPLLLTPGEQRVRRWKRALNWCTACLMVLATAAVEFSIITGRFPQ